jgi:hypothetical protein
MLCFSFLDICAHESYITSDILALYSINYYNEFLLFYAHTMTNKTSLSALQFDSFLQIFL